jgi:hypothetical protein
VVDAVGRNIVAQAARRAAALCRRGGFVVALLLAWTAVEIWLQHHALSIRADGVWAGHLNIWSDWPLHLAMAGAFADRAPADWFSSHPMFAGGTLHYPFVVNLLSGLLMRAGLELDLAMSLPTLLAGAATPLLLYRCLRAGLDRAGPAVLAVSLFFLASGLGGFGYLAELMERNEWQALLHPAREVSRLDRYDWYTGNFLTGMLVPQRAFVLGLPLALLSLLALIRALSGERRRYAFAIAGGCAAGLLPIVHVHSYIALALIGLAFALLHLRRWRVWGVYAVLAAGIGLALAARFINGGAVHHLRWAPGFAADGGFAPWLLMWWKLWGLALPLTLLALPLLRSASPVLRALTLGGAACFVFANLVLIQPNRWDNAKLFLWAYLCWTPLWAGAIASLWSQQHYAGRTAAAILVLGLSLTGAMELARLINVDRSRHMIANADDVRLALQVRAHTDPMSVFLTDTAHNHPIMAFGARSIFLGFTGWMANLGFDHAPREADLRQMYAGGASAERLLERHRIDYVVIGPSELRKFEANRDWYAQRYPLRFANDSYQIFELHRRDD